MNVLDRSEDDTSRNSQLNRLNRLYKAGQDDLLDFIFQLLSQHSTAIHFNSHSSLSASSSQCSLQLSCPSCPF
jgi:hypothetical protein